MHFLSRIKSLLLYHQIIIQKDIRHFNLPPATATDFELQCNAIEELYWRSNIVFYYYIKRARLNQFKVILWAMQNYVGQVSELSVCKFDGDGRYVTPPFRIFRLDLYS